MMTTPPQAARRQGVDELDIVDCRGTVVGWTGPDYALVEFVHPKDGHSEVACVPIVLLTHVSPKQVSA